MSLWPRTIYILISTWPRTRKFSHIFKIQVGRTDAFHQEPIMGSCFHLSHHSHTLITLYVQFLCSDWSKFDRWVDEENLYSVFFWNLFTLTAEADRVLGQLAMFLAVFFHWVYKMKYSYYQESTVIEGWFVYWIFGWEMRRLSKSQAILALLESFQELHLNGKPE